MGQRRPGRSQLTGRLTRLSGWLAVLVVVVAALAVVSFVVALLLIHTGNHSAGLTTVTTAP